MGTITGVTRREKQLGKGAVGAREKEAKEQLGLEEKLGRAVTKLVCPPMDSRVRGADGSRVGQLALYLSSFVVAHVVQPE